MKKFLWSLVALMVLASLVWLGFFYSQNLRGAYLAVKNPDEDVVQLVQYDNGPFTLPPNFTVTIFAKDLKQPRVLAFDPNGVVVVSVPTAGVVYALPDADHDGKADKKVLIQGGLNKPHGISFRCANGLCQIYIAETNQLAVYDYDPATMQAKNKKKLLDLPTDGYNQHYTRTLFLTTIKGQDTLLISVGSSCNVCNEQDDRRAKILFYNLVTGESGKYARGLRNAVFLASRPGTDEIWATEMGRDLLGDDIPPDEINVIEQDANYGWPTCFGQNIHDTKYDQNIYLRNPCMEPFERPAKIDLQAHSAPLGLAFIPRDGWPKDMVGNLLVAYHGSWNRSVPTGYLIKRFILDKEGRAIDSDDFLTGFITTDGKKLGRPVALLMAPGGGMYVSDDAAGVVYWVQHK